MADSLPPNSESKDSILSADIAVASGEILQVVSGKVDLFVTYASEPAAGRRYFVTQLAANDIAVGPAIGAETLGGEFELVAVQNSPARVTSPNSEDLGPTLVARWEKALIRCLGSVANSLHVEESMMATADDAATSSAQFLQAFDDLRHLGASHQAQRASSRLAKSAEQDLQSTETISHILSTGHRYSLVGEDPTVNAVVILAKSLGVDVPAGTVRLDMSAAEPLEQAAAAGRLAGLRSRQISLPKDLTSVSIGPFLTTDVDGNVVVGVPAFRGFTIVDPRTGQTRHARHIERTKLDDEALVFTRRLNPHRRQVSELLRITTKGSGNDLLLLGIFGMVGGLSALILPLGTKIVFSEIVPNADVTRLLILGAVLVIAAVGFTASNFVRSVAAVRLTSRVQGRTIRTVWDRLLSLPASFFRAETTGSILKRFSSLNQIPGVITNSAVGIAFSGVFGLVNLALIASYGPVLTIIGIILAVVPVAVTAIRAHRDYVLRRSAVDRSRATDTVMLTMIKSVEKVRVAAAESRAMDRWSSTYAKQMEVGYLEDRRATNMRAFASAWKTISTVTIVVTIAFFVDGFSAGDYMAFTAAFAQLVMATAALTTLISTVTTVAPLLAQAKPILDAEPETDPTAVTAAGIRLQGNISLIGVSFGFVPGKTILDDLNLDIKAGQSVAVVGPSGAGKSTLTRLLVGLEKPTTGTISYDGRPMSEFDLLSLRRQIGVVLQDGDLAPGSIRNNITLGRRISAEQIAHVVQAAGLTQDLAAMPMGLETVVDDATSTLSGGQKQRILIARTLIGRPKILILDEATSALDNVTQKIVTDSLKELSSTRIVVAHRLATIMDCDRVIALEKGRIVQDGSPTELANQPGLFQSLVSRQS